MRFRCLAVVALTLVALSSPLVADFRRGDANSDGTLNVGDPVAIILSLFAGVPLGCADAADVDDDGAVVFDDAMSLLRYLFRNGSPPPAPGPLVAGPDPTCDALDCDGAGDTTSAVIISEIHYDPAELADEEFVELQNLSSVSVDLSSYRFTNGIDFTFPQGSTIEPGDFAVLAKNPGRWEQSLERVFGPYEGWLADGGERLTLESGECVVESLRYDDRAPWPTGADGYGASLERIDVRLPAEDFHSWRASTARTEDGLPQPTPGAANAAAGVPAFPAIETLTVTPAQPRSSDEITVRARLDFAAAEIASATLEWYALTMATKTSPPEAPSSVDMVLEDETASSVLFAATLPPQPSQTLVRYRLRVELEGDISLSLPHSGEPRPFFSTFVYDSEIASKLPLIWLFPAAPTPFTADEQSGFVLLELGAAAALNFDGARVIPSDTGHKLRFLKGEEYRGDRTLNLHPETGVERTSIAPIIEHFSSQLCRDLGLTAPRVDWFRAVEAGDGAPVHSQRLALQQINEAFLRLSGLDDCADLYKLEKDVFTKKTNLHTGREAFDARLAELRSLSRTIREPAVFESLDAQSFGLYSAVSVFISNWDGFRNNFFLYVPAPPDRWRVFPWDLDQTFQPWQDQLPVTTPRQGIVSRGFHLVPEFDAAYLETLRDFLDPQGRNVAPRILDAAAALETLLLDDLTLIEAHLGVTRDDRRSEIREFYDQIREFVERRVPVLRAELEGAVKSR